jgi:hypothetical protein
MLTSKIRYRHDTGYLERKLSLPEDIYMSAFSDIFCLLLWLFDFWHFLFQKTEFLKNELMLGSRSRMNAYWFGWVRGFISESNPGRPNIPPKISVLDPEVFGPPGSVSASEGYGSVSRSSHQIKIVRKLFISTVLWLLYDFFYLWRMMYIVPRVRWRRPRRARITPPRLLSWSCVSDLLRI